MILIVPALLGGGLQMIQLVVISPKYIRFFSVSQVIPDGLMILFIFGLFFLWLEYMFHTPKVKNRIIVTVISIYISFVLALLIDVIADSNIYLFLTPFLYAVISLLGYFLIARNESLWNSEHKLKMLKIIAKGSFILSLIFIVVQLKLGKLNLVLPSNFANLNNLNNRGDLIYFNDQYVFLKRSNSDSSFNIEVLKFDAFFENQNTPIQIDQTEIDSLNNIIQLKDDEIDSLNTHISQLNTKKN
jgi:hypothetical protein